MQDENFIQYLKKSDAEKFCRYLIKRHYFGVCDTTDPICACPDIQTAKLLVDLLGQHYKDRPMTFHFKKIATEYLDFLDDEEFDLMKGAEE